MAGYHTKQRALLLNFLSSHAEGPLSAAEIVKALSEENISASAVYRNLAQLEGSGEVRRVNKGGIREAYFQYLPPENCKKHLHLSCKSCGRTYHMGLQNTDILIKNIQTEEEFEVDRSDTILYGTCKECREKRAGHSS